MKKMGKRREKGSRSSQTLPSSPSHSFSSSSSSSSSDFEFTISLSPRKSSTALCPADELFYKGQLLPLHLSPRISMVRTLLLASSSAASSSSSDTTASRDSTGSSSSNESASSFASDLVLLGGECDSSRPSSVTEDEEFKRLNNNNYPRCHQSSHVHFNSQIKKSSKYFSLSRFSSVFKKESKINNGENDGVPGSSSSVRKMSSNAKDVIRKYLKKVRPLYEKLSQKHHQKMGGAQAILPQKPEGSVVKNSDVASSVKRNVRNESNGRFSSISHSFSGNLRYPRRRNCVSSCPSSMRSSPSHSGVLSKNGFLGSGTSRVHGGGMYYADTSSMEELQSAIQGAIAHCKNSLMQNKAIIASNAV